LYTSDVGSWVAKDRHDAFGDYVIRPTIPNMVAKVEERLARGPRTKREKTSGNNA
jgi:hypothetical protein